MRFDDDGYIEQFKSTGRYPKIHDDIFSMSEFVPANVVIDLGCCTGLLSHRLSKKYRLVVGVEPSHKYIEKAIQKDNIKYVNMGITEETLSSFKQLIKEFGVDAIFARRVIPEIFETGGFQLCSDFIKTIYDAGVKYIVIEGRKSNRNAKNPLHSIAEEAKIFDRWYVCVKTYNNCQILKRKDV